MELKPTTLKADKSKILSILYSAGYEMYLNLIETISMELKPTALKADKSKILSILYSAGYEMYLHGTWKGPKDEVEEYSRWEDLLTDIDNKKYGENLMFRIKGGASGK